MSYFFRILSKIVNGILLIIFSSPMLPLTFLCILILSVYDKARVLLIDKIRSQGDKIFIKSNSGGYHKRKGLVFSGYLLSLTLIFVIKTIKIPQQGSVIKGNSNINPERKALKYWEYLLAMLPGEQRKEATHDLEDFIADLKERRAYKIEIFLMVLMHLMPLLPAFIRGRIPLTAKKKVE